MVINMCIAFRLCTSLMLAKKGGGSKTGGVGGRENVWDTRERDVTINEWEGGK